MSTRPEKGCQKRKPCAHEGRRASGTIIPESAFTKIIDMPEARRVLSATTAQLMSTVKEEDNRIVRAIERTNRSPATRLSGGNQAQLRSPESGSRIPAMQNMGSARKLVFATRQAMARISQRECVS